MKYLILLFFISSPVMAWELGLEQGESNSYMANPEYYTSSKYSAVTFREGHTEAIIGSWYGESYGRFVGLSAAYASPGKTFYDVSFGGIYLIDYSGDQLDGRNQFMFSVGIGRKFDDLKVSIKFRHISNSNTQGKNWGQEFILIELRY